MRFLPESFPNLFQSSRLRATGEASKVNLVRPIDGTFTAVRFVAHDAA